MIKLDLDTFWGSSLSFALNIYNSTSSLYPLLILALFSLTGYHNLCNLIIALASTHDSSKNTIIRALSSSISAFLLDFRFKKSFKPGELVILSQLISKLVISAHEDGFKGWPAFFLLLNAFPFVSPIIFRKQFNFIPVGAWIVLSASFTLDKLIITDLIEEITRNLSLGMYWALTLSATISTPLLFPRTFSTQNSLRKFFHFAAAALFIPAAFSSLKILRIALAVAASLFLLAETLRNEANSKQLKAPALISLNEFMETCRNGLDSGEMVFSHLYLLLGCAIPFWFNPDHLKMSSFAGVIALGIGDSLASIGGKAFGRIRWHPRTRKTVEGSISGCVGMFASWLGYKAISSSDVSIRTLLLISVGSSLWEALVDLNDNITLPIFTFIIINILTS